MIETLQVPVNIAPTKLRQYLNTWGISGQKYKSLKSSGGLSIDGSTPHSNQLLLGGESITLEWEETHTITPEYMSLDIVYEDDYLLIVNKPADMLIHPTGPYLNHTLVNYIAGYYEERGIAAGIHPISRLDRQTSGLVIFAKKSFIQFALEIAALTKLYVGIVTGSPSEEQGMIDLPIGRKEGSIIEREINGLGAKPAQTKWQLLRKLDDGLTLMEFQLLTGRTHQIRVHCASQGWPLLGDNLYGNASLPQGRHYLHCYRYQFLHPMTKELLTVTANYPGDFQNILNK